MKISELASLSNLASDDEFAIVDTDANETKRITAANLGIDANSLTMYEVHREELASPGRFDISSIPQTYDHLYLFYKLRSSQAASDDSVYMFFNNDTTVANYYFQRAFWFNNTSNSGAASATPVAMQCPGANAVANNFVSGILYIPMYASTNRLKVTHTLSPYALLAGESMINDITMVWEDGGATAINRITIQPDGYSTDNFIATSEIQLIAVKAI